VITAAHPKQVSTHPSRTAACFLPPAC
jgi:hypothetical protein